MKTAKQTLVDIEIDKLTNSIENTVFGDVFSTEVFQLFAKDGKQIKKSDWLFNWQEHLSNLERQTYKLVIKDNLKIIQGLVCLSD